MSKFALNLFRVGGKINLSQRATLYTSPIVQDIYKVQDEADFKSKVLNSKKLVLVDFFATWCGPCKMLTPRLESIVGAKGVDLAKIDVDELDGLAGQYNISSVPSVFAMKNGKVLDQFTGLKDDDQLENFIDNALKK